MEEIERQHRRSFANNAASVIHRGTAIMNSMQQDEDKYIERRGGFCYNLAQIWGYRPSSQEQLKEYLCSESNRLSTFLHKQGGDTNEDY